MATAIRIVVYIRPIGAVGDAVLRRLEKEIRDTLELPVKTAGTLAVPEGSFDAIRGQYYSTRLLRETIRDVPGDALRVLGVVDLDICIPILTFVFGEAQLGGVGALVSLARLRQEFYGLAADEGLFAERLRKESLHELGHTFGLVHCPLRNCVMSYSNTVADVDRKGSGYCRRCQESLLWTIESEGG